MSRDNKNKSIVEFNLLKWLGILFAFLGLIVLFIFLFRLFKFNIVFWSDTIDFDKTSSIGSFVGGVAGALWSLTGVILFYLALRLQTQQLELQKVEIQATRSLLSDQQFENKFFNLLNVQKGILNSIQYSTINNITEYGSEGFEGKTPENLSGLPFFENAASDFHRMYIKVKGLVLPKIYTIVRDFEDLIWSEKDEPSLDNPDERIKYIYKRFFSRYHPYLGHYFRHLYYILRYIDETEKKEIEINPESQIPKIKDKFKFYAGVVQAQMSTPELFMLFYDAYCFPKLKEYVIKWELLQNLWIEELADKDMHKNLYGEEKLRSIYELF